MGTTVETILIEMQAKFDQYERDVNSARSKSEAAFARIEQSGDRMGKKLGGAFKFAGVAAAGFVASIGVDTVVRAISAGLDYASSLGEIASQLGVSTTALQEYRFAASQSGIETAEIDQALGQLTRRIGEGVSGSKAQVQAFEKLGISLKNAKGEVLSTGDAIPLIADGLKRMGSVQEQSAVGTDLFGRSFQKLLPLLEGGSKGLKTLTKQANDFGGVLSSEQIAKADKTADDIGKLQRALAVNIAGTVADNSASILALANALAGLVVNAGKAVTGLNEFYRVAANRPGNLFEKISGFNLGTGAPIRSRDADVGRQEMRANAARGGSAFSPTGRKGGTVAGKSNAAASGLSGILGTEGLGTPGAGTGLDIKSLQGLLVAELIGPTKKQAAAISAATIELEGRNADLAIALADLSGKVAERAAAEKLRIDVDAKAEAARIQADDLGLKAKRTEAAAAIARAQKATIDRRLAEEEDSKRQALNAERLSIQHEALDDEARTLAAQVDGAETREARFALETKLLDKAYEIEKSAILEAAAKGKIADVNVALANLATRRLVDEQKLAKQSASPLGAYRNELTENAANINDRFDEIAVRGLRDLNSGLTDAIVNGKSLGDALEDSGKRALASLIDLAFQLIVIRPLLEGLKAATDGDSTTSFISGASKALGSIFGGARAMGGPVSAGRAYKVGELGEELFVPQSSGVIIPNNKLRATGASGGVSVIRLELSGDIDARMLSLAQGASIEVVRVASEPIINRAVAETFRRAGRPRT